MKRKSQIQIGETIAVLFVFFILIMIGFIFYVKVIKGNIEVEKDESSQMQSIGIAQRVMFLPELQCSEDGITKDDCIDKLKLRSAKDVMDLQQNKVYYYDLLEFSEVSVTQIYPDDPSIRNLKLYSRKIDKFTNKFVTNVPVSLYNPITKKYGFGVITIETYSK